MASSEAIKDDLSEMTFSDLLFMKKKLGSKVFNETVRDTERVNTANIESESSEDEQPDSPVHSKNIKEKKSKAKRFSNPDSSDSERPFERPISSTKQHLKQMRKKQISPDDNQKHVFRDPRFDDISGNYNETYFKQAYSFLPAMRQRDMKKLTQVLKTTKDDDKKMKVQRALTSMKQREQNEKLNAEKRKKIKEMRNKEREMIERGKAPFYLKKSVKKKMEESEKVEKMKSSKSYDKQMIRKEKKKATKERKQFSFLQHSC